METIAFLLIGNDIVWVCAQQPHQSAKMLHYLDLNLLMKKRSLEPCVKGRKDIYTPHPTKEPLHSDSLFYPLCTLAKLGSFSAQSCFMHH